MNAWELIGPPFLAGLLVLLTHVPLGLMVLARGIVFMDLAVAQLAALGMIAADLTGWTSHGVVVQLAAAGGALAGGLLLAYTERRWPEVQEALIGVLFVLAAAGAMLVVAGDPHAGEHLRDMLGGQILWVGLSQVGVLAAVSLPLALLLSRGRDRSVVFYGVFALAVTASVQLVGVYLVFASLIVPALAVRRLPPRRAVPLGIALGAAGYAAGLAASARWDLPAGPVIVWGLALCALAAAGLARLSRAA